jgi:GNAT superfamily N-acetyltransferase
VERSLGAYLISTNPARLDLDAIFSYLSGESYWARGRPWAQIVTGIENSIPFGVYLDGRQVGFARIVTDYATFAWLADVYVLEEHRGRGLGVELVRFSVDEGPLARTKWYLHTRDAHDLYRKFGFTEPSHRVLERTGNPPGV